MPTICGAGGPTGDQFPNSKSVVNSRVLLTVMFLLVVTPLGALGRLFGSDPLGRRAAGSLWLPFSKRARDPKHYERMF